jgi:hypothetical protein
MLCMYIYKYTYTMATPHRQQRKNARKASQRPPVQPAARPQPDALRTAWSARQLLGQFQKLLPRRQLPLWLAMYTFYERAFTPLITLWYLVFQRLSPDHTLSAVLTDARDGGADRLSPRGKRLSRQLLSTATAAWSDARQRLPLACVQQAVRHSAQQIGSWIKGGLWHGWKVLLLDGSTLRLRPHNDIPEHFPPHRPGNCKKEPYWCLARVVVGFCLATGVVVDCALGACTCSEQVLAALLLSGTWTPYLIVGDRNFGVYSVVRAAEGASAKILVRLTQQRAAKLARQAQVSLTVGLDVLLDWTPSQRDQCPKGLTRIPVAGRLIVLQVHRPGFRALELYLFTTLTDPQAYSAVELAQLYGQRWLVELNLRYLKTQMELEALESYSADMAQKEWWAGLLAYNLIRSVMAAAAAQAHIPVRYLSFSRARQLLWTWLVRWVIHPQQTQRWERLLLDMARCRHPRRSKPRPSEPRAIRWYKRDFLKLEGDRAAARQKLQKANAKS